MDSTPNQKIDVDLLHLKDARDGFSRDADGALKPGIADANGRIFRGLNFGLTSQSGEVDASRRALAYAMDEFLTNGEVHVRRAAHIVNFLDKMLEEYRTADEFANLDVSAVLARLAATVPPEPSQTALNIRGFVE